MPELASKLEQIRSQFPALSKTVNGQPAVFFDGPAGTQVPQSVIDAISHYLVHMNANHEGAFVTSRDSDELLAKAHRAAADFVGSADPDTVSFGPNMTTLTFALARALSRTWSAADEIIVTQLDHDANVAPWVLAARDAGATVHQIGIRREDCTLDLEELKARLCERTRLVAVGCASNASGTINPVRQICDWARDVGAYSFLDAVHFAPHARIDVEAFGCDFLACSAYKFFGPHIGLMWGRRSLLEETPAYKVRPASNELPGKWMSGTQSHEGIAGTLAAIDYLADLGRTLDDAPSMSRSAALDAAAAHIVAYERKLITQLLRGVTELKNIKVWGITDLERLNERVPTISITHAKLSPARLAQVLDEHGIFVWHGNYYALSLTEALGLEPEGMVRIGLVHYNTPAEIDRLLAALTALE